MITQNEYTEWIHRMNTLNDTLNEYTTNRRVNLTREPHLSPCDNENHPCGLDNLINFLGSYGPGVDSASNINEYQE
jgi:hypothetical protein